MSCYELIGGELRGVGLGCLIETRYLAEILPAKYREKRFNFLPRDILFRFVASCAIFTQSATMMNHAFYKKVPPPQFWLGLKSTDGLRNFKYME